MDWKDVGKAVGKVAPILGTALGGPQIGGLVSIVAGALGIKSEEPQPGEVMEAIKADPEAAAKLLAVQDNNRVEIERIALQRDQAYLQDRQNARSRQVESEKATGSKDVNLYVLAYLMIFGFFILTGLLCFVGLPDKSSQAVFILFGALVSGVGAVTQYFFGSSKSSADKTKMLGDAVR